MPSARDATPDLSHTWVIPCLIVADRQLLSQARQRNYVTLPSGTKLQVVDIYCQECHRPYAEVSTKACAARVDNSHLRGGPADGSRRKRKKHAPPAGRRAV